MAKDTIAIDTLSIAPGSLTLSFHKNQHLDSSLYEFEPAYGRIILNRAEINKLGIKADTLYCTYRVLPILLTKTFEHKDINVTHPLMYGQQKAYVYQVNPNGAGNDPFDLGTLNKSGSISRGVTFGNTQNLAVNSSLNLQLNGKLSNNVNVMVSATDNSLPIQPEGNTQQLQDFDKVFIKLYNQNNALIAGDYEIQSPAGYFMKYYKKAQGGVFTTRFMVKPDKDTTKAGYMKVTAGAAISKGKFARNMIQAIDGNLGPYRLTGTDNENFIVVLSGTEKVYLDGQLMQRGQGNDYIIDYNAAQVTFTPRHMILQTTRIEIEFQYSDLTYLRSLVFAGTEYHDQRANLRFNIYSEQDAKTQPLQQSLSQDQINFLASIGNNIQNALVPAVTVVSKFDNTLVLYRKVDTTVGTFTDTVFVYSTDSTQAKYQLAFSQVAQGQGDYVQVASAANGKVFKWVAPVGGVHQGNFIPEVLLITPKKKQMVTLGGDYKIAAHTTITAEGALSNNDVNTFASNGKTKDVGFAGRFNFHNIDYLQDSTKTKNAWRVTTDMGYEGVQKYFSPIERYRTVEFSRDWNRTSDSVFDDQNIVNASIFLGNKKDLFGYALQAFLEGGNYNATRHTTLFKISEGRLNFNANGSLLSTQSMLNKSTYYKEAGLLSYKVWHWTVGAGEGTENDIFRSRRTDSIIATSSSLFEQANTFQYQKWNAFIRSADTGKVSYGVNYEERTDFGAKYDAMTKSLNSRNISFDFNMLKNPKSRFKANVTYHILDVKDSTLAQGQQPVNALVGQAQYDLTALHGFLFSSTYYQAGSGLQPKESYVYIAVAQGQGNYAWTDFNHDGIKELNEFYVSPFQDQNNYIRVYTPTSQFIKTYTSGITETFNIRPSAVWNAKKGFLGLVAKFSDQFAYHVDRKTTSTDPLNAYNPFLNQPGDSNVVGLNSSLRNSVFFNQLNPKFGADYSYSDVVNKTVLQETGQQARENRYNEFHGRANLSTRWMLEGDYKFGNDISASKYFASSNYYIDYTQLQPKLNYQPGTSFRISLFYTYATKVNADTIGVSSIQQTYGAELRYNVLNKGSLLANFNYVQIAFNGESSSPLGFEILQGLNIGNNYTWGLSYQFNISQNIQMNISYNGRSSPGSNIVNTGTMQVRAFF